MEVSGTDLAKDVRVAIDENTKTTAFTDGDGNAIDADTVEMDDIIRSKIVDGINAVRMAAPLSKLELTHTAPAVEWIDAGKGIGQVTLPDDYLRLAMFRMSDWTHGVAQAISPVSPQYAQQFSEWKGVRGNPSRPMVAVSADAATGGRVMEFFSSDDDTATARLVYVAREDGGSAYHIEDGIYRAVVLKTAALTVAAYGNGELMQLLNALSEEQCRA